MDVNAQFSAVAQFRVKIAAVPNAASRQSFDQATDAFNLFIRGSQVLISDFNEELVCKWVSWLFNNGYTYKTVVYYVNRLASLYGKVAKDVGIEPNACFTYVKEQLKHTSALSLEVLSIPDVFGKLRRLVLTDCQADAARQLGKDIVLFSLYNGGMPLDRLAYYKKNDYTGTESAVLEIVARYSKAKNKYLFPLRQSERTPKQLGGITAALFASALKSVGIELSSYPADLPADLWVVIALRSSIPAADVACCIGEMERTNPIYSFAARNVLSMEQKEETINRVTSILSKDPVEWYAMQFRPHVDYEMIQARMKSSGIAFAKSFYPMEDVIRRVGKKIKRESKPVVPGLLFFKSKATALPELFFHIGDLAWGYRYGRNAQSPYAIIPPKAIADYQQAVGKFIDCLDSYPAGYFRFEEGDKVEITGGDFRGQPAIFEKEIKEVTHDGITVTRITNRLKLAGIQNCSWTVELDPRQMVKISDKRFEDLQQQIRKDD